MECVLPWQFSVAFLSSSKLSSLSCCLEGCFCTLLLSITALFYTTHTHAALLYLNRHCVSRVWSSVFKDLCPRFFAVAAWHSISCHFLCHPEKSLHLLLIRPSRFCCHLESDKSTHWYTFFHLIEQFFMLWAWVLCALRHREWWSCFPMNFQIFFIFICWHDDEMLCKGSIDILENMSLCPLVKK